jgi:hypothetical protein
MKMKKNQTQLRTKYTCRYFLSANLDWKMSGLASKICYSSEPGAHDVIFLLLRHCGNFHFFNIYMYIINTSFPSNFLNKNAKIKNFSVELLFCPLIRMGVKIVLPQ